jgi:hypothetical protein
LGATSDGHEGDDAVTRMKLTLRFRRELPSNGRPEEKHAIRLQLHSQLQAYWQKDSRLKDISKNVKGLQTLPAPWSACVCHRRRRCSLQPTSPRSFGISKRPARVEEARSLGRAAAPNFAACFLAMECPHLNTDGLCDTVRHCRIGWLAGWWCLDLRRLLANSARADLRSGTDEAPTRSVRRSTPSISSKPPSGLRMPVVTTPKALKSSQVFFPPSSSGLMALRLGRRLKRPGAERTNGPLMGWRKPDS